MIQEGQILQDRYRIERKIGQGGMGAVFVALDERLGSRVAIKETFFSDEGMKKAFEREARLLNSLRHAALPRVSDHFFETDGQFLVMEFIEGVDLAENFEDPAFRFPVENVLGWADQLLDALEYLHSREMPVIHRDIKPQNLKLTPDGRIVLLDFGLAKGNPTTPDSATAAKSVVGYSRNYAPIEQIQGSGTDPRSDLYSLSATIYHLLTGTPPVDALTRAMSVLSGNADPLTEPAVLRSEIPFGVSRVIVRAMALNADDRPSSAAQMREEIRQGLQMTVAPGEFETAAGLPDPATHVGKIAAVAANAPTMIMSGDDARTTQIKHFMAPGDTSSASGAPNQTNGRGYLKSALFAVSGLLVAGGVAWGALFYFGQTRRAETVTPNTNPARTAVTDVSNSAATNTETNLNQANADQTVANSNSASDNAATRSERDAADDATAKPSDKLPETKGAVSEPTRKSINPDGSSDRPTASSQPTEPPVVAPPNDMPPPPDGRRPPPRPGDGPRDIPRFVWEKMTPRERRDLKRAMELERRMKMEERQRQNQEGSPRPPANVPN